MHALRWLAVLCGALLFTSGCASSPKGEPTVAPPEAQAPSLDQSEATAPLLEGMGDLHWAITTQSELAQRYFDQALTLAYGFNHLEAERSFREAARLDDDCAMCFWGAALVLGPNINDPVPTPDREVAAYETLGEARARAPKASEKERALIEALEARYAATPPSDRAPLNQAYADAMRTVAQRFPDDLQIQTLFAEAMMDTMPWAYWSEDGEAKPLTEEVFATLDFVIERDPDHPGANHFYIHAVEQEQPERGVAPADRLRRVVPGAGHLVHMPSHIYIRVGRYHDGSLANELAVVADNDYVSQCRAQGIYPLAYVPHNHHFLWATTTMEGRSADALAAARHTAGHVDRSLMREPELAMLQHFSAIPYYALVRFGMWDENPERAGARCGPALPDGGLALRARHRGRARGEAQRGPCRAQAAARDRGGSSSRAAADLGPQSDDLVGGDRRGSAPRGDRSRRQGHQDSRRTAP